jgi:hypothetical protein
MSSRGEVADKKLNVFIRTSNEIDFKNLYGEGGCKVLIDVKIMPDGLYKVDYTNKFYGEKNKNQENIKECHPLYYKSIKDEDEDMMSGLFVAANPITFHMLQCLMSKEEERKFYDSAIRPFDDYCGEIMRALTELEF